MAEKYPADKNTWPTGQDSDLSGEETNPTEEIFHTGEDMETNPKELWGGEEGEVRHRNESSTFVKEVNRGDEGEGSSGSMELANEFGEAASRLPDTVQNVTFVHKTVVHGNMTKENIMYKHEGDGGLIQHKTVMAPENQPRQRLSKEELENKEDACIDKIHDQIISAKDIEMGLTGLGTPDQVIPPDMEETTKDEVITGSVLDEKYVLGRETFIKPKTRGKKITFHEMVRGNKRFALIGAAGSGKSTTLKKFVKELIKEENKNRHERINPKKQKNQKRKLMLYIELKLLEYEKAIKPGEALLIAASRGAIEPEECEILVKWMGRNPSRVVIALDGYDQIPRNITKDDEVPKYGYRNSTTNEYLHGLLVGHVLPDALVVLSTREYALQNIPYICVPERVIKLVGLSHENIDKLVVQLSNENVLEAIKKSDRVVYFLCSSPLFLMLVTWVHACMKDKPPETKSGILMCIVINFLHSNNITGKTLQNLYKLAELALHGVKTRKIVFTQDEINHFGLEKEDLKDMVIGVPKASKFVGNPETILTGHFKQYFLHQMLQEILSALKIIMMEPHEFDDYVEKFERGNFEEVSQLTYGILFRDENIDMLSDLAEAVVEERKKQQTLTTANDDKEKFEKLKELSEHRTIALKHLEARLEDGEVGDLQTLRLLYESGDAAIIQNNVKEIGLYSLNEFDCFCLGKVLEKSKELSKLWLPFANDDLIGILIQSCEKIPKIDSLKIIGGSSTTIGKYYGKLSNHANKLVLWECEFTKQEFDSFVDEIEEKFTRVELELTFVGLEHLDGLIRLMSHIDGTLDLSRAFIFSSEVREKIPRQYKGCTVEYYSERWRTVQPVPQIEAEQPIATEGDIPRLNQRGNESENESD